MYFILFLNNLKSNLLSLIFSLFMVLLDIKSAKFKECVMPEKVLILTKVYTAVCVDRIPLFTCTAKP